MDSKRVESNQETDQLDEDKQNKGEMSSKKKKLSERKEIEMRLKLFQKLYETEAKKTHIPDKLHPYLQWKFNQYLRKKPSLHTLVNAFETGMKWQTYDQRLRVIHEQEEVATRQGRELKPQLLGTIIKIIEDDEIKNGPLPVPKNISRKHSGHDTRSYVIDKSIVDNFKHILKTEEVNPPVIWQKTMGHFFEYLINDLPVRDACSVAVTAGVIYQKHSKKLERYMR